MSQEKKRFYQQGDVLIELIDEIPKEAKVVSKNHCVLAEGEVTGHSHQLNIPGAQLLTYETQMYLTMPQEGVLQHEEHKPINLPSGNYSIKIVREYDHMDEETRRVAD